MKNKLLKLLMVLAVSNACNNFSFADYDLEDAMEDHYKNMNRMNMMNMHPGMMGGMGMSPMGGMGMSPMGGMGMSPMGGMGMHPMGGMGMGMHHYHHQHHAFLHGLGAVGKIALGAAAGIGAATYPPMYY